MYPLTRRSRRARNAARVLLAGLALALIAAAGLASEQPRAAAAKPKTKAGPKPSFVLIQTDDQTLDELYATYNYFGQPIQVMPNTLRLIGDRGMTFTRYYVSYPLCCPSRVSLLTGRYAHNHNVRGNVPPNGGYPGFAARGAMGHNLAVWLHQAGYRTIHVGKFLNGYGDAPYDDGRTVPPGWSAWHSVLNADTDHFFYGYTLNDNGAIDGPFGDSGDWDTREYGIRDDPGCPTAPANGQPCYYETDVLTEIAASELLNTPADRPFYLQLDYTAPHGDFRRPAGPEPAPRHYDTFAGAPFPHNRLQGLNEGNVSDKPRFIRDAPPLSPTDLHTYRVYHQKALESLRSIDEGIKRIIDVVGYLHRLRNTYVIFISDNGFFFGEHRLLGGKFLAYEPATHLPLLIRGPHIRPGTRSGELVQNIDIAPTILELAGAKADKSIDGRSLVPFLHDPDLRTRRPLLFESFVETADVEANGARPARKQRKGASASILAPPKDYEGLRLGPWKYIAWPNGQKELYDLRKDPYELNNRVRIPNFFPIRNFMHRWMARLEDCVGRECRVTTPKIPLTRRQQAKLRALKKKKQRQKKKKQQKQQR